jgi:hypothetical protein
MVSALVVVVLHSEYLAQLVALIFLTEHKLTVHHKLFQRCAEFVVCF